MDLTREDIMNLINWKRYGFELLPGARNGKIGLEYAKRYQPDIILTDIKMPVMTGLDMVETLKREKHEAKVIFLTAYEEFDLARRAVEMNVDSFILKYEIDEQILLNELNKLVDQIEDENRMKTIELHHRLQKILQSSDKVSAEENVSLKRIGESMFLGIWIMQSNITISEKNLYDLLQDELSEYKFIGLKISEQELIIFLKLSEIYSELQRFEYTRTFILRIQELFKSILAVNIAIAIGGVVRNGKEIYERKQVVSKLLGKHIFYKDSCILEEADGAYKYGEVEEWKKEEIENDLKMIQIKIESKDYLEVNDKIKKLFETALVKYQDMELYQGVIVKLSFFLRKNGYELKYAEIDEKLDEIRENIWNENIYQIEMRFQEILKKLQHYGERIYSKKIQETIHFLNEHYSENIGLNEIAGKMGVSAIYLSQLFKKETGLNFSAYLTKVRIDKAKELLRSGDKKIYEISEIVGYQTVQYFNKVFKKETGKTPKEFE